MRGESWNFKWLAQKFAHYEWSTSFNMSAPTTAWNHQVNERINLIVDKLKDNKIFAETEVPGLLELLDDENVSNVEFSQRFLRVFKDSETDGTYSDLLSRYTPGEQEQLKAFVNGEEQPKDLGDNFVLGPSLGCREELSKLEQAECIAHVTPNDFSYVAPTQLQTLAPSGVSKMVNQRLASVAPADAWFKQAVEKMKANFVDAHHGNDWIKVYKNAPFQNWGLNVANLPNLTCVPNSVAGIRNIVQLAKEYNMGVRCSGYSKTHFLKPVQKQLTLLGIGHSWSPIFGQSGQILISMLDLATVTKLPNIASLPLPERKPTELETIEVVPGEPRTPGNTLVRVGCAATNERLRRWCVKENKVTIPLNVIMVEITLGGSNAPICHGAGLRNKTLSDLVRKIEYIDAHGEIRTIDKAEHLKAASGCFGLMGVVTHITLEFQPMTYALLDPKKMPVIMAVPPPPGMDEKKIPPALLKHWEKLSSDDKKQCQFDFERRATVDYYAEWFWFPYSDNAWVNTWKDTADPQNVEPFPSDIKIWESFGQTFLMNVIQNSSLIGKIVEVTHMSEAAVTLISKAAMRALPSEPVKTFLPDALHFQRAIQNVRVRDIEVELPLVAKKDAPKDAIDFAPVQQAWWDAILLAYDEKNLKTCPMRMPLEIRIMGGSDVIMAPQRGNSLGTCSIEVLTLHSVGKDWPPFAQSVLDKWMALEDPSTGQRLKTRPHWAKEWYNYKVDGKPWIERLKLEDYKQERELFLSTLQEIGEQANWTLGDLQARFSNDLFDQFFFESLKENDAQKHNNTARAVPMKESLMESVREIPHISETSMKSLSNLRA
ncbi:putative xylitol oxidase [Paramyrothecium foliicola]|nr:putative xylitol oxidase [Paramyrothecium foliicola]